MKKNKQHSSKKLWVVSGIFFISLFGYVLYSKLEMREILRQENLERQEFLTKIPVQPFDPSKDHARGNLADPRVVVIEFSDLECIYCKRFHFQAKREVFEPFNNQIAWVYRHYPLDLVHPRARKEAEAVECAASQKGEEGFWEYLETVYAITPSNNRLDPAQLYTIAQKMSLDMPAFDTCVRERTFQEKVENQSKDGFVAGVRRTPSVIVWDLKTDERTLISGTSSRVKELRTLIASILLSSPHSQ